MYILYHFSVLFSVGFRSKGHAYAYIVLIIFRCAILKGWVALVQVNMTVPERLKTKTYDEY